MTEEQQNKKSRIVKSFITYFDGIGNDLHPPSSGMPNMNTYIMGVTKLDYDIKTNVLHVWLRRPGLLIGKRGETIDKVEKWLGCKIHVKENIIENIELN